MDAYIGEIRAFPFSFIPESWLGCFGQTLQVGQYQALYALIGNTYGKYLERDTGTPLIRMVFPIFDRHHYHRYPIWGYEGGLRVLVSFLDEYFETLDANTIIPGKTDYSYDIIR